MSLGKNRRNTIWTYVFGLAMLVAGMYGAYAASNALLTRNDCGELTKTWNWWPPEWQCGRRF